MLHLKKNTNSGSVRNWQIPSAIVKQGLMFDGRRKGMHKLSDLKLYEYFSQT
jgi:hypothetical protein